jgi:hypothetical protein
MYSIDVNGERLTPLFPPGPWLVPGAVSRSGGTIAYVAGRVFLARAELLRQLGGGS